MLQSIQQFTGQIADQYGFRVEATPMDELRTISPIRLVGATFNGTTIDTNFWTSTVANGGTNTQANSQLTIKTNTTANGSAIINSILSGRYTGGTGNRFRAQIQLGQGATANNVRRWGMFTATDGCFFEIDGSNLKIVTRKGSIDTAVASTSWNNNTVIPTLTDVQSYEIYFTNAKVYFVIGGVLKHTVSATSTTWTDSTFLPIRIENTNSGDSVTDVTLYVRVATIYRMGELSTAPRYAHITSATTTVLKYSSGMLHNIVVNNPTNNSITVYDNFAASGSVIAIIDPDAGATPFNLDYHVPFSTGLTIVTAGTPDLTVIYE